ncbi:hypothetical protein Gogos_021711, partial [Gossypium gossypioides]|nr:hypothetical protein [Gossypium gossypioides]
LLTLIAKRLETQFDVLRFRSIYRSWRSSFSPKRYPLPKRLPSSKKTKAVCRFSLNQITIATLFLVRLPPATENRSNQTDPSPPSPPLSLSLVVISPCAACKILRRRCADKYVLAPYFPPTEPAKFAIAHRVFGASNIIKFLQVVLWSFLQLNNIPCHVLSLLEMIIRLILSATVPTSQFSPPLLLISPAENQLTSVMEKKPHCTDSLNQTTQQ